MDLNDWDDIQENIQRAVVVASGANTTIVSAVSGKQIILVYAALYAAGDAVVRLESGNGGTALTGQMQLFAKAGTALDPGAATGKIEWSFNPAGWVATSVGQLLNLEKSGADVNGVIGYILQ